MTITRDATVWECDGVTCRNMLVVTDDHRAMEPTIPNQWYRLDSYNADTKCFCSLRCIGSWVEGSW